MLEMDFIREHTGLVRKDLEKRGQKNKIQLLEKLIEKDKQWRAFKIQADSLRMERNNINKKISDLLVKKEDVQVLINKAKQLPIKIKELDKKISFLKDEINKSLFLIPNILHESVPVGIDESENVEVKKWGCFDKKPNVIHHGLFAEKNNLADFSSASRISGAGFYFLKSDLALMEFALMKFAIDLLIKKGFTLINPPLMMRRKSYSGVTDLEDFEKVMYKIEGEDLYLIATSEHPLAAMYSDKIFDLNELPVKLIGFSPCFRKEIGKHSIDERGLFRVHQFYKIEQFVFSLPDDSWKFHEELLANAEELVQKLEIPYRVVNVCTGDIGSLASKKYDIECWSPREQKFIELVSCSNCTGFQATRLNIKFRKNNSKEFVHTLNSTAIASSRALRLIIENFQTDENTVLVPKVLQPYMLGLKEIPLKDN